MDKKEVRELVEPVGDDEPELQVLCKAFEWMIQDAQYHAIREVVGQATLFEAHKKEVNKEPNMPFDSWIGCHHGQELCWGLEAVVVFSWAPRSTI